MTKSLNGVMERINGVEAVFRECVAGMKDDVKQLRAEIEKIRTNEIAHIASEIDDIRGDIETLKRFMWRTLGAFAVIVFLITIGSRLIKF